MANVGYVTMDQVDFNDLWYGPGGIQSAVDQYRAVSMPTLEALTTKSPEALFKYGISDKNGFQKLAVGQRPDRKYVQIATMYPTVSKYGYGVGTDLDTLRRSTAKEIMLAFNRPFLEDPESVLIELLAVMMSDPGGANAGYGFYNGAFSSEERITAPPRFMNNVFSAGHTHYYTSGSATVRLQDFTAAKQTIRHHGNNGPIIAFINSQEQQALENLAAWTSNTIIRNPVSDMVSLSGFGDVFQLLGVTFYVTELAPAGYIMFVETGNDDASKPVVHFEPANIAGLQVISKTDEHPLVESFLERWMGYKVSQRGKGVCVQITASSTYTNPTFQR